MNPASPPVVHALADVRSSCLGSGTEILQFAVVSEKARIGSRCRIGPQCFVGERAEIEDDVNLSGGVHVARETTIESSVVIGPCAVLGAVTGGDHAASSVRHGTRIRRGATVGAGATILAGVDVGTNAVVEPGAVVIRSVPPNAIVRGNPAQIAGYVRASTSAPVAGSQVAASTRTDSPRPPHTRVRGVTLHDLPRFEDVRGSLVVGEFQKSVPFATQRFFTVFGVPTAETRGEHAHRTCHQFLICVHGSCSVVVDDGDNREEFQLDRPNIGLHLPPMVWGIQYRYTSDAVVLVFASELYDPNDYVRDYDEFIRLRRLA